MKNNNAGGKGNTPVSPPPPPSPPKAPQPPQGDFELNVNAQSDEGEEGEDNQQGEEGGEQGEGQAEEGGDPDAPVKFKLKKVEKKVFKQLNEEEIDELRRKFRKYILQVGMGVSRFDVKKMVIKDGLNPDDLDVPSPTNAALFRPGEQIISA
jgi:hypothetical protein